MLAIIGSAEMIKTDNEKLANIIGGKTYTLSHLYASLTKPKGTTANAIRQRVAKIKNQAKAVLDGTGADITFGGATKVKSTPKKASAGGKNVSADDDDEKDSAAPAPTLTPKKRAASGKAKGTPRAKKVKDDAKLLEQDGDEEGGLSE